MSHIEIRVAMHSTFPKALDNFLVINVVRSQVLAMVSECNITAIASTPPDFSCRLSW